MMEGEFRSVHINRDTANPSNLSRLWRTNFYPQPLRYTIFQWRRPSSPKVRRRQILYFQNRVEVICYSVTHSQLLDYLWYLTNVLVLLGKKRLELVSPNKTWKTETQKKQAKKQKGHKSSKAPCMNQFVRISTLQYVFFREHSNS